MLTKPIQSARKLYDASDSLLRAENFKEVMRVGVLNLVLSCYIPDVIRFQLILLIGNYMNNTGHKGGAFGFKVSSINKVRSSGSA